MLSEDIIKDAPDADFAGYLAKLYRRNSGYLSEL